MGSDQSKYAGSGEKSAEVQEVRLDYYALLNVDEEATDDEIKVRTAGVLPLTIERGEKSMQSTNRFCVQ